LEGGPKDRYWYWLSDWHVQRESARAQHLRPDQPAPTILCYQPTGRHIDNPNSTYGQGEIWRYEPPPRQGTGPDIVTLPDGEQAVLCRRCRQPAPDLITARLAHLTEPDRRCPRCAYPPQRYLGAWVETMPTVYQQWYDTHPVAETTPPVTLALLESKPRDDTRHPRRLNQEGTAA
jgi:hypothetical protein